MGAEGGGDAAVDQLSDYTGSTLLSFLCDITTLKIDQVNFISCQLFALLLSYVMRKWIKDPTTRLWYTLICGVSICWFCFGTQIFHIIISAGVCYLIISTTKSRFTPWFVLVASMGYLSFLHIKRQFFDHAGYALDITGPLMVLTQKLTSLAFSVMDGVNEKKDQELTPLQKQRIVREMPNPVEFCSYVFQFQSMLAGPLVFYDDFKEFVHVPLPDESSSPGMDVAVKLVKSIFFAVVFLTCGSKLDVQHVRSAEFLEETSSVYKMGYIVVSTTVERCKYYHAWILADCVCNMSGLGYDRLKGTWDAVSNVHPFRLEMSLNLKEILDNWNIGTMKWLRYVVYERSPPHLRTNLVYMVSAFWHGFYPGYYITFLSGALFTNSGRVVRKLLRPYFLNSKLAKSGYDFVTWVVTRMILAYVTFAFVVQDFYPTIAVYMRIYFFLHVFAILSIYLLPLFGGPKPPRNDGKDKTLESGGTQVPRSSDPSPTKMNGAINPVGGGTDIQDGNSSVMKDNPNQSSGSEDWRTHVMNSHEATSTNTAKLKTASSGTKQFHEEGVLPSNPKTNPFL